MENLHRDLFFAVILCLELGVVNGNVLLEVPLGQLDFLVLALPIHAHNRPVGNSHWKAEQQKQEDIGLEATTVHDGQNTLDQPRDDYDEGTEVNVVEGAVAFVQPFDGGIFDGRGICLADSVEGHRRGRWTRSRTTMLPANDLWDELRTEFLQNLSLRAVAF